MAVFSSQEQCLNFISVSLSHRRTRIGLFFFFDWILRLVGHQLQKSRFVAVQNSLTIHVLVDVVHEWSSASDSSDTMVTALLPDYRKALDLELIGPSHPDGQVTPVGTANLCGFTDGCISP